jgi:hypothetical protein
LAVLGAVSAIRPLLHALIATLAHPIRAVLLAPLSHAIGLLGLALLGVPALHLAAFHLAALDVATLNLATLRALSCTPGTVGTGVPAAFYGSALTTARSLSTGPLLPLDAGHRPLALLDTRASSLLSATGAGVSLRRRALAAVSFLAIRRPLGQGQLSGAEHCCSGGG